MGRRIPYIRNSERKDALRCAWKWWQVWREGLQPIGAPADPLWFGTGVHISLADWYCGPGLKRGPYPADTWARYAKDIRLSFIKVYAARGDEEEAKFIDALALGAVLMEEYIGLYGRDDHMDVIQPEQTFALDIPWPESTGRRGTLARFVGTYDLAWRDLRSRHGDLWLEEHKTAKTVSTLHLTLDSQGGSYWATAARSLARQGLIPEGTTLRGIEYNFIRKGLPDTRPRDAQGYFCNKPTKAEFLRDLPPHVPIPPGGWPNQTFDALKALAERHGITVLGERSKLQPKPLFERHRINRTRAERASQLRRIQDEALLLEKLRRGELPITKNNMLDCPRCPLFAMCELHEASGNWEEFRDLQFRRADPYADHRKSAEE